MVNFQGNIFSKLPNATISIFAKMSALAREYGAINLSQGFPDFEIDQKLIQRVTHYMDAGCNQYAPYQGVAELRQAISHKIKLSYDRI